MNARTVTLLLAAACACLPAASAQSLPTVLQFDESMAVTSSSVIDLGDVDGDGADDLGLLATGVALAGTSTQPTRSAVVSGRTGLPIHDLDPWTSFGSQPRRFVRMPDLDGDGAAEFLTVGQPQHISAIRALAIHSGSSGAVIGSSWVAPSLHSTRIASIGDVTGDGVGDLGIADSIRVPLGFTGFMPVSFIDVVDGATFTKSNLVTYFDAELPSGGLVGIGDVDGDGHDDLVSGSGATSILVADGGTVTVYSGQTGLDLRTWFGAGGDRLGERLVPVGDVDGDGALDVAVFSPGSDVAGIDAGRVEIFSTATGARWTDLLPAPGERITDLTEAGDHDGDGLEDVLLEVTVTASGTVRREIRSAATGALVAVLGAAEIPVGDLNGDRIDDLVSHVAGQPTSNQTRYTARTLLGGRSYGNAPGAPVFRWVPGALAPANGMLELTGAPPSVTVVGVVSFAPADTLVSGTTLPLFVSDAPGDLFGLFLSATDAGGVHQDPVNLTQPGLGGVLVYVQYGILSSSPMTTNAVELLFGPS